MDNKKIGQRIKQVREALGMTQAELARRMGYSARSTINRIENGSQAFPMKKLDKFAQVLDVTPAYLAGFTEADIPEGLNKEYYIDFILDSDNPELKALVEMERTSSNDLCTKIKACNLDDSEVDYMDKQLDFIVGQRK
ncbi:helix-turn-helix domain-containing protein [Mogibacterium sp.]|uniref:helix-turn-helix domain-containing protein n=1 Tax=Mogibacterium sp. TaxID=2049035 RepID=UPI002579B759|nr:helix-turn-helix transcriptional regulator [Mogibacterium sp.]MBN2935928.1 helix-turn-helix transcriptional regulator [Mogibacterium sp.]